MVSIIREFQWSLFQYIPSQYANNTFEIRSQECGHGSGKYYLFQIYVKNRKRWLGIFPYTEKVKCCYSYSNSAITRIYSVSFFVEPGFEPLVPLLEKFLDEYLAHISSTKNEEESFRAKIYSERKESNMRLAKEILDGRH